MQYRPWISSISFGHRPFGMTSGSSLEADAEGASPGVTSIGSGSISTLADALAELVVPPVVPSGFFKQTARRSPS